MATTGDRGASIPLSMRVVAQRTGLSAHVIRVWEKRYQSVTPRRTPTNRRYYTVEDVERLILLRRATEAGHGIGTIARLPDEQLRALVSTGSAPAPVAAVADESARGTPESFVEALFATVLSMDTLALESLLDRGAVVFGQIRLLNDVLVPLLTRIGEAWQAGQLKVAHEHIASAAIRGYLAGLSRPATWHPGAPAILVTTPAGQIHEVGAALVAAVAAQQGWRVVYAGAAMPATEIAAAAIQNRVRAVALSIVYPSDDPALGAELLRLTGQGDGHLGARTGGGNDRHSVAGARHRLRHHSAVFGGCEREEFTRPASGKKCLRAIAAEPLDAIGK